MHNKVKFLKLKLSNHLQELEEMRSLAAKEQSQVSMLEQKVEFHLAENNNLRENIRSHLEKLEQQQKSSSLLMKENMELRANIQELQVLLYFISRSFITNMGFNQQKCDNFANTQMADAHEQWTKEKEVQELQYSARIRDLEDQLAHRIQVIQAEHDQALISEREAVKKLIAEKLSAKLKQKV
jgi:hypothetical protein